jgi:hypothetical protein
MSKEKFEKKFVLQIGNKVLFGIYKKEVIVKRLKFVLNKNEDEIE